MFTKRGYIFTIGFIITFWCALFAMPVTRAVILSQWGIVRFYDESPILLSKRGTHILEKLAQKYPHDVRVQALAIENKPYAYDEKLDRYDNLIERFPRDEWLIQKSLRLSMINEFMIPHGSTRNKTEDYSGKNWLSAEQIRHTLQMARLGKRLNPQNTFYTWAEAMCLFALDKSDEAIDALQRGATKTLYDDGNSENMVNRLYVQHLAMPILAEDRLNAWANELFPQYAQIRAVSNAAVWYALQAEKSGDHARALDVYGALIRLDSTMFRDSKWTIGVLITQMATLRLWAVHEQHSDNPNISELRDHPERISELAQNFAQYAEAHGDSKLAHQSIELAQSFDFKYLHDIPAEWISRPTQTLGRLNWLGSHVLKVLLYGAILMSLLIFVHFFIKDKDNAIDIEKWDIVLPVIFVVVCIVASTILLLYRVDTSAKMQYFDSLFRGIENETSVTLKTWSALLPGGTVGLLMISVLFGTLWKARKANSTETSPSKSLGFTLRFLVIFLWAIVIVIEIIWASKMLNVLVRTNFTPLTEFVIYSLIPLPLIGACCAHWLLSRQQVSRIIMIVEFWRRFFLSLRQTLLLFILCCSIFYGVSLIASRPVRHLINTRMEQAFQVGEVRIMQELNS